MDGVRGFVHACDMGSSKKPKMPDPPPPPPPPITVTGADMAQENAAAKKREKNRFDFKDTIIAPGRRLGSTMPEGTKRTLG